MRIFYSVETQIDFMNPGRPMYAPGVEIIKPNLLELKRYALKKGITQVGGLDAHFGTKEYAAREVELQINGGPFPLHCEINTEGYNQIPETSIAGIIHPHYLNEKVDRNILMQGLAKKGLLFEKQKYDIFTNPAIDVFMREFGITEAVVSGVLTDWCVKDAVLGMRARNVQVYLVNDGIYALNLRPLAGERALEEMIAAGAKMVTTKQVLEARI